MLDKDKQALAELLAEKQRRIQYNKLDHWFPKTGPYRYELYKKHIAFIAAGATFIQRAFIAANQSGKTQTGGFEMACHLTGLYPDWWMGKKFDRPVKAWGASKTITVTRDAIQQSLLGPPEDLGSGMIPKDLIIQLVKKPGSSADAFEKIAVRHITGGISTIHFKSYDGGRETFQGTSMDIVWLDEEPSDPKIYSECLTRLIATKGIIYCTFTPLFGVSEVVLSFLKEGKLPPNGVGEAVPGKFVVNCTWDDVPHLDEERKKILLAAYSHNEREARTKGIPTLGAGSIYPYLESDFVIAPFELPTGYTRFYGLDVGWNVTAATFCAKDTNTGTVYIYDEYYGKQAEAAIHAYNIKCRGQYIPGFIDPASRQSNQATGLKLLDIYQENGLYLSVADNAVEPGILAVAQFFAAGKLKIFSTCSKLLEELRMYHRDENGKIIKKNDHLVDAMRYAIVSGYDSGVSERDFAKEMALEDEFYCSGTRDTITGY